MLIDNTRESSSILPATANLADVGGERTTGKHTVVGTTSDYKGEKQRKTVTKHDDLQTVSLRTKRPGIRRRTFFMSRISDWGSGRSDIFKNSE